MHKYILLAGLVVVLVGLFLGNTIMASVFLIIGILVALYGFYAEEKVKPIPYAQKTRPKPRKTKRKKRSTPAFTESNRSQCPECGSKNTKSAVFCAQCGKKLK